MEDISSRIVILLDKYINEEELDEDRKAELRNWIDRSSYNRLLLHEMMNKDTFRGEAKLFMDADEEAGRRKLTQKTAGPHKAAKLFSHPGRFRWIYMAAAVLIILFSVGAYFFFLNHKAGQDMATMAPAENRLKNDVAPGTEKAILTLANGTKIPLDSLTNGAVAQQGNTVVIKEDGLLAYNADKNKSQTEILYNTLTTPRGGEYRSLVLADGTKVWLNSASSIHFPTAFISSERLVEITGEVYFEVAKNPSRPFRVKVNGIDIEVLGTHFNVNAYGDETLIKTTLLEGSVKVINGKSEAVIKPGQQAQIQTSLSADRKVKVVNDVDVNATIAWKNGLFVFNQADIKEILRQVSRWYDVDIQYKSDIKVPKFYGEIPRTVSLSEVLKILEINSKLQFTIEKNIVTVRQGNR